MRGKKNGTTLKIGVLLDHSSVWGHRDSERCLFSWSFSWYGQCSVIIRFARKIAQIPNSRLKKHSSSDAGGFKSQKAFRLGGRLLSLRLRLLFLAIWEDRSTTQTSLTHLNQRAFWGPLEPFLFLFWWCYFFFWSTNERSFFTRSLFIMIG